MRLGAVLGYEYARSGTRVSSGSHNRAFAGELPARRRICWGIDARAAAALSVQVSVGSCGVGASACGVRARVFCP